ncbi:putative Transport protein particle (TRAPP) component [Trypanosoma vivax]|uniref:Trafficking protein particle complex subunit n=1 Tax=Trypanosoma vivax (strain Y486) TaxID=1055687 RepID=G0TZL5_TRYVY|nr:putative Transport protein particle (TRAPP) component [Trypanosoma vivax]CCC50043.1 conserved hypothetical protein [Trypanosoma vivax Y486]
MQRMNQHLLVSEGVVSTLNMEIISYILGRHAQSKEPLLGCIAERDTELHVLKEIESISLLVGLRLTERLLYREATFSESTPMDIARFVGQSLWKAVFGKRVDRVRHMDKVYFCLIDNNFRWLQGHVRVEDERFVPASCSFPSHIPGSTASDTTALQKLRTCSSPLERAVLRYATGILRGAIHLLCRNEHVKIHANRNEKNEVEFVLDFRAPFEQLSI